MKTEKNEMYVLRQPEHAILTAVIVNEPIPFAETIHNNVDKLVENSDVVFIYSGVWEKIDLNKLASLYSVCAWIEVKDSISETLFKVFEYSLEIFDKHVGFNVTDLESLKEGLSSKFFSNTLSVLQSTITKPVFKIRRLNELELFTFYANTKDADNSNKSLLSRWSNKKENSSQDDFGTFCTHRAISNVLFIKRGTIKLMLDFIKEFDASENHEPSKLFDIRTFNDCRYLLASFIKYIGIETLDFNIEDLDIGKLS